MPLPRYTNAASTTSGPRNATRSPNDINTYLKPDRTSHTFHQQVSHLTTHNTVSSLETNLVTDMIDRHTAFHTTLQVITSQGSKPLHVKGDPGSRMQFNSPVLFLQSISQTLYKI